VAQQFKATITEEGGVRGEKDIKSTLYRKIENYNLGRTFQGAPIVGISFGRRYDKVLTLWGSSFALGDFVAHNQILWLFVEMGVLGALAFWFFFNTYIFRSSLVYAALSDPYFKSICAICILAVINQMVVSYVDMQLTYYRNMVYLGVFMGLVPVIHRLDDAKKAAAAEAAAPPAAAG
jgi:O-antigen ligase